MFDRETRRTHLLDAQSRSKYHEQIQTIDIRSEEELVEELSQSTEQFWSIINQEKEKHQEQFEELNLKEN